VSGQCDLPQIVDALSAAGCFTRTLHGGKQERDQDRDDRDGHQQLDERETGPVNSAWIRSGHVGHLISSNDSNNSIIAGPGDGAFLPRAVTSLLGEEHEKGRDSPALTAELETLAEGGQLWSKSLDRQPFGVSVLAEYFIIYRG
jgi:hypothetical protein